MEPTQALEPMKMNPIHDHSRSYRAYIRSADWYARRRFILKIWRNRCALFPWLKAGECHHLTYQHLEHETAWVDCIPLSKAAHGIIHVRIPLGRTVFEPFFPKRKPRSIRRRWFNLLWRVWSLGSLILIWVGAIVGKMFR